MFNRLLILSAALWCAFGITAGTLRSVEETAPAPLPESGEPVLVEILAKADRLPLAPADPIAILAKAFADQAPIAIQLPSTAIQLPSTPVTVVRTDGPQTVGTTVSVRRHHPTDVCARHGMHKQITRGGHSWRCRR